MKRKQGIRSKNSESFTKLQTGQPLRDIVLLFYSSLELQWRYMEDV